MTRKHYIELARILKSTKAPMRTILAMAEYLGSENPNFNHQKFIEACQ